MQVRADVIDERLRCSHDDALGICSLALQCEVGDYKAVSFLITATFFQESEYAKQQRTIDILDVLKSRLTK